MKSRLYLSAVYLLIATFAALRAGLTITLLSMFLFSFSTSNSAAQQPQFPERPVKLIVPWPAGGATDIALRSLAAATEGHLGQPIVIENRPGASGTTAPINMTLNETSDGYTISQIPTSLIRATAMKELRFDPVSDLTHVICLTGYIFGIVVRADAPWRTLQELLADAKARPGAIRFGSSGYATTPHIVMMRIAKEQDVRWTHVPFKGNAGSVNALLGRHVDVVADGSAWSQLVSSGEFRLLATWGESRHESWPDAPTLREIGIDIVVKAPYGLAGPKGMRPEIVSFLHDAFRRGMQEERYNKTLKDLGQETLYLNGADYRNAIRQQLEDERQILKGLDIATAQ